MRTILCTTILVATLSASLQASAQTRCDAWLKGLDDRAQVFNSECARSPFNYSRRDYCEREHGALQAERFKILHQCDRFWPGMSQAYPGVWSN
jgi:hypothetical protein